MGLWLAGLIAGLLLVMLVYEYTGPTSTTASAPVPCRLHRHLPHRLWITPDCFGALLRVVSRKGSLSTRRRMAAASVLGSMEIALGGRGGGRQRKVAGAERPGGGIAIQSMALWSSKA
jgi:hypothetical protein